MRLQKCAGDGESAERPRASHQRLLHNYTSVAGGGSKKLTRGARNALASFHVNFREIRTGGVRRAATARAVFGQLVTGSFGLSATAQNAGWARPATTKKPPRRRARGRFPRQTPEVRRCG